MNWEKNKINLGTVSPKSVNRITYKALNPELKITVIKPKCGGCTKVGKFENGFLPVTYTASDIPKHLLKRGDKSYLYTGGINITYLDGTGETLTFTAKVEK